MPAASTPSSGARSAGEGAVAVYDRWFALSLDLLCVAGLDGYFRRVNPSWTRVLGWTEEELLSHPVEFFMHPEDREKTLEARRRLGDGVAVRGLENRYRCKDGSYRWLAWQSVVEPGATTVFAIARDITERRQLDEEQIVLSKLESTGILAGGLAHDFNNLLAGLLLNLEMVSLCDPTTQQQEQYLRQGREAILAAKGLTQQLLAFAEGGVAERRLTNLKPLLRQSVAMGVRGSTVRGQCDLPGDLWLAEVDEGQIGQVLRNLILNAREAMPAGGAVRLQADNVVQATPPGPEALAGDYVRIRVTDTGAGIAPDVLGKVFDPYFSTKRRGTQKGMGLGLTICRTAVQKHGGTISIASGVGQGTTVTILLPAVRAEFGVSRPESVDTGVPQRILVMEDEEAFRDILAQMLRQMGYEVGLAHEGGEAVVHYQRAAQAGRPFAAVLLDLTVRGGMGGREAMQALRAFDPGVRAVLMTGHSNEETFLNHAQLGFKGALGKPFSGEALRAMFADVLREAPDARGV